MEDYGIPKQVCHYHPQENTNLGRPYLGAGTDQCDPNRVADDDD
jgi:hypothetical protein